MVYKNSHLTQLQNGRKTVHFGNPLTKIRLYDPDDRSISVTQDERKPELDIRLNGLRDPSFDISSSNMQWIMTFCDLEMQSEGFRSLVDLVEISLLGDNRTVQGIVEVANIAYEKTVTARYSFNDWRTMDDVVAVYAGKSDRTGQNYDLFKFNFAMESGENSSAITLQLCVCYVVLGHQYWDNNGGQNYHINFLSTHHTLYGLFQT
ncbi:hypothetical protein AFLA70_276g000810 [Aspergillus flavus AF70]|nr:hypothetical protein AFLA70_276g000810 [Aspergillus flavus AF70]